MLSEAARTGQLCLIGDRRPNRADIASHAPSTGRVDLLCLHGHMSVAPRGWVGWLALGLLCGVAMGFVLGITRPRPVGADDAGEAESG